MSTRPSSSTTDPFKVHPSDFVLISSTGTRFHVQKVVLIANSPVFRIPEEVRTRR
ncbi:hypothetical protein BDY24DRAFT_402833 [Mrakia frigida]|uniref:uncharacterized protein n=1 Tax=Mrakia frigida TaxID=29902 RepID=UPI003FCC07F7